MVLGCLDVARFLEGLSVSGRIPPAFFREVYQTGWESNSCLMASCSERVRRPCTVFWHRFFCVFDCGGMFVLTFPGNICIFNGLMLALTAKLNLV